MNPRIRRPVGAAAATVLVLSLGAAAVQAPTGGAGPVVRYGHDERGRLASVTDAAGGTAAYRYDPAGNLVEVSRQPVASAEPAGRPPVVVTGFSPAVVRPGERLTITGENFTGDVMLDQVVLDGTTYATVESASPTELVVTVPPVVRPGPVSVPTPTHGTPAAGSSQWTDRSPRPSRTTHSGAA